MAQSENTFVIHRFLTFVSVFSLLTNENIAPQCYQFKENLHLPLLYIQGKHRSCIFLPCD